MSSLDSAKLLREMLDADISRPARFALRWLFKSNAHYERTETGQYYVIVAHVVDMPARIDDWFWCLYTELHRPIRAGFTGQRKLAYFAAGRARGELAAAA